MRCSDERSVSASVQIEVAARSPKKSRALRDAVSGRTGFKTDRQHLKAHASALEQTCVQRSACRGLLGELPRLGCVKVFVDAIGELS